MNFSWSIDGTIIGLYLVATIIAGLWVRKYVSRVEDFLVAGREMSLYLGVASLAATEFGIITCLYTAQAGYTQGFAGATPGICQAVAMFVIGMTGFCVKPLRASGSMTLPELFEKRYGPFVRWLSGVVIVLGGLLNMGVFLKLGGDFLRIVCGFDARHLAWMMAALLLLVVLYTAVGGMLSVLVTDYLQFVVMSAGLLVCTFLIVDKVGWEPMVATVAAKHGAGGFNPFVNPALGWPFVVFQIVGQVAATLTWQAVISRLLSAKDADTGRRIYTRTSFFFFCRWLIPGMWGIAALVMIGWAPLQQLSADDLAKIPADVQARIAASPLDKPLDGFSESEIKALPEGAAAKLQDTSLHAMPRMLSTILPIGILGLLIAAMLAAEMSTDSSYMLSWGSVIYNDILAPLRRRRAWSERKGLLWNRFIVALIGVYIFCFGLLYKVEGDMWSYLLLTGSIYLASMSSLLIACCYWKRANNWGALGAIILGAAVPVAFLTLEKLPATSAWAASVGKNWAGLATYAAAAVGMILGSLLKPRTSA